MTPENKRIVKIIAITAGVILILAVITVLIVKQLQKGREERENGISDEGDSAPPKPSSGTSGGSSSTSSFGGRTFSKSEIVKMQSFLMNMGAMAMNDLIYRSIRETGGLDGKIGTGFKTAYNEAIRIGIIKNLDDLYTQAMKLM